jgi:pyruvate dehydrogenase (quinone)
MLGWAVVPMDLPFVTGPIGLIGSEPSWDLMQECDTLLMIGSSFPYSEFLPKEGQARGVQIDIDARLVSLRYPMEVGLVGDSTATLRALLPKLTRKTDRTWRQSIEAKVAEWRRKAAAQAARPANPLNPHLVFQELSARLPDDTILAGDSGTVVSWLARNLDWSVSGGLATMGSAVPYAIAAKFAHPTRPAIALAGDGAMQMLGNSELVTVAKYWRQWADPRLVVLVVNNRDLGFVTWEQRLLMGNPRFPTSQDLPDFPFARYAELIGLAGRRVERPEEVGPAWEAALAANRPFVLEVLVDPDVPPMPLSHLTPEQAEHLAQARQKGDAGVATGSADAFKEKLADFLPSGVQP